MDAIFGKDAACAICEDALKDNVTGYVEKTPEQIEKEHLEEIKHKVIRYYEDRNNGKAIKRKILRKKNNMLVFDYLKRTNSYNHYLNYTMIDVVGKLQKYNLLDVYEEILEIICNNIRDNIDIEGYIDFIPYYYINADIGYTKELQDLAIDTWKIIDTKSSAVSIGQLKKSRRIRNKNKLEAIEKLSIKLHEEYETSESIVVMGVYNLYKIFELDLSDDKLTQFVDCIIKLIELDNI